VAKRSVLVICEDIKQLVYVHTMLTDLFKSNETDNDCVVNECFRNLTIYQREHDAFDFNDGNMLKPSQLIIATNLAGRGTDIKLSMDLVRAGGLHVIISFMPKNCRIEEQAFGRAARYVFYFSPEPVIKPIFSIRIKKKYSSITTATYLAHIIDLLLMPVVCVFYLLS
jgi:hypothetical protein